MSFRQTTVSGFPAIALRSEELEVVVVPALGMKLTNLRRLRGREWLWRNGQIPLRLPKRGASYVETADSGGWDECFPTVGPSLDLPDHGELWSQPWEMAVTRHDAGVTLHGQARGTSHPLTLRREVTLLHDAPVAHAAYALRNDADVTLPWLWSAHPMFNTPPGTVVEIPGLGQLRVNHAIGDDTPAPNDVLSWRGAVADADGRFTMPEHGGWAVKLFGDVPAERRRSTR